MKIRVAVELIILMVFIAVALVVVLWSSKAIPADVDGRSAQEYVQEGDRLYVAGKLKAKAASVKYWEALALDPNLVDARLKIASIYYNQGWNHESLRELSKVESIDPNYPGLHLLRGKIYHEIDDNAKEFESFQQAIISQPDNPESHYYLGTLYQRENRTEEAIVEYEKAVELDAVASAAESMAVLKSHLQLGRIFRMGKGEEIKKDEERAEKELKMALKMDPASAQVISELRIMYGRQVKYYKSQRDYDKVAEIYAKILEVDPNDLRNVTIYLELGDRYKDEAYDVYEKALEAGSAPGITDSMNKFYDEAAEMYEAARKLDPTNSEAFAALRELEILRDVGIQEQ